ncbi:MAG: RlpA-like double-psi beta-barrel domain-containing protein [Pseudomonadota bacterium]|nr:RlpA-like double-psi beta-barrel domain-containing protein [Pseudomonadota bacterium]
MRPNISFIFKQISFFIGILHLTGCSTPLKPSEVNPVQDSSIASPVETTKTQMLNQVQKPIMQPQPQVKPTPTVAPDYQAQGLASWYTLEEHGKKTASGKLYDMYNMTAAHASLPLLTPVEVKHLRTGKRVVVTITDRLSDPNVLIKLSNEAAQRLQLLDTPHPKVEVRYLPTFSNS